MTPALFAGAAFAAALLVIGLMTLRPDVLRRRADAVRAWWWLDDDPGWCRVDVPSALSAPLPFRPSRAVPFLPAQLGMASEPALELARTIAAMKAELTKALEIPAAPEHHPDPPLEVLLLAYLELAIDYRVKVTSIDETQDYVDELLAGRTSEYHCGLPQASEARAR